MTWNNYPEGAVAALLQEANGEAKLFSWILGQLEIGEEAKTPHVQAVLYNRKGLSKKDVCAKFKGCWLKAYDQNYNKMIEYVQKSKTSVPDSGFEGGQKPEGGAAKRKHKVQELYQDIAAGNHDKKALADKYQDSYMRIYRAVDHVIELHQPAPLPPEDPRLPKAPNIELVWLYGMSGTGKTNRVKFECWRTQATLFQKKSSTKQWWDGYRNEECILLDDFRGSDMSFHEFLQLTDPYRAVPHRVQTKGGHLTLQVGFVVLTPDRRNSFL